MGIKTSNNNTNIDLSVIISVYNYQFSKAIEVVIKALKAQTVNLEIVLCEQNTKMSEEFSAFCAKNEVKYIHTLPDYIDNTPYYNLGRVRNIGAALSRGKYLYFNDADILIHNKNYFERLIEYSKRMNHVGLIRPRMRRLLFDSFDVFCNDYMNDEKIDFDELNGICLVSYNEKSKRLELIQGGERVWFMNNLYHTAKLDTAVTDYEMPKTIAEYFATWKSTCHYGGTLCSYDSFCKVGGYCEEYYNWGMEDTDIQWKLNYLVGVQSIDNVVLSNSVLHFEHDSRFNNEIYKNNFKTIDNRRRIGVKKTIDSDLTRVDSFMSNYIHQNHDVLKKYFDDSKNMDFRDRSNL